MFWVSEERVEEIITQKMGVLKCKIRELEEKYDILNIKNMFLCNWLNIYDDSEYIRVADIKTNKEIYEYRHYELYQLCSSYKKIEKKFFMEWGRFVWLDSQVDT